MLNFIEKGFKVAFIKEDVFEVDLSTLKNLTPKTVMDVTPGIIYLTDGYIEMQSLIINAILFDKDDKIVDPKIILEEIKKTFPNIESFNNKMLQERLIDRLYIFHPCTAGPVEFEEKHLSKVKHVDVFSLISNNGFLDAADYLYECTYFNEDGTLHDTSDLVKAYELAYTRVEENGGQ